MTKAKLLFLVCLTLGCSACELVVQLNPMLVDASISDACPICSDASVDAVYGDAADVSVYGVPPDAGVDARADITVPSDSGLRDAATGS